VTIRPATPADAEAWLALRRALWTDQPEAGLRDEIVRYFAGQLREPVAVLLACDAAGAALGMAELNLRSFAEGCTTDPVGYLEGWYVVPGARGRGVGRALVAAAEDWARARGCREFASDTVIDNDASAAAHRALGFTEVERIRCFRKDL